MIAPSLATLLLALAIAADILTTHNALENPGAVEGNPLVRWAMKFGDVWWLAKLAGAAFLAAAMWVGWFVSGPGVGAIGVLMVCGASLVLWFAAGSNWATNPKSESEAMMGKYGKAIAAVLGGLVTIAAAAGLDVSWLTPELTAALGGVLSTILVYIVPNSE